MLADSQATGAWQKRCQAAGPVQLEPPRHLRKGSKSLRRAGMSLRKIPRQPGASELMNVGRKVPPNHLHESWLDFLYWDAELEA